MKLKELLRVLINEEMSDISLYRAEAEVFGADPGNGESVRELFGRLAEEEAGHLKLLGVISKGNTGFRQRKTETPRSIEASLRMHADREGKSIQLYSDFHKMLEKPEYKEALKAIITQERAHLASIRELQAKIKKHG